MSVPEVNRRYTMTKENKRPAPGMQGRVKDPGGSSNGADQGIFG